MNKNNIVRIISITSTVLSIASGLLSNWASDHNMKNEIAKEVSKQLNKRK